MDEIITKHAQIMDRYDPEHKVSLLVDEWGTWFDVEPGTNPGFLYQQNTMRDAMVAALSLNIFNRHSDRVAMANIAQLCNVLQAVVLTEGDKMVLTPTYHVFDLYKDHQDATLLGAFVEEGQAGEGENTIPMLSVSASEDKDGVVHVTAANLSPLPQSCPVELDLLGGQDGHRHRENPHRQHGRLQRFRHPQHCVHPVHGGHHRGERPGPLHAACLLSG